MRSYGLLLGAFVADESGQNMNEYVLVGAMVGLSAVVSFTNLAIKISTAFNSIGSRLTSAL